MMPVIRLILMLVLISPVLVPSPVAAAPIYVYQSPSGDRLITNKRRPSGDGYKLLRQYQADDYFGTAARPSKSQGRVITPRPSDYDDLILATARQLGIEPALMKAIIHIESAFNPLAISPKGASGLMQLMPGTAQRYGVTDRFNPTQSLDGGGRYMRDLLLMFNHDTRLALAAYNAGENAVTRYQGIPPYAETQDYVEKVMRLRDLYRKEMIGV